MSSEDKYRTEPPDDLPSGIENWPYEQRIEWAKSMYLREGLIMQLLTRGNHPNPSLRGKDMHLTKEELAAIYLAVRGVAE
ncbi:hypothetical protein ACFQJ7_13830 [Halovenus rubra]|uniref:Uncharacterized protein n=2 Tax=Halovenus rubra TaxID=869890 RepID=A0ACC7DZK5_9EURY|nr:hypothetical protein [Halovenus rubra]